MPSRFGSSPLDFREEKHAPPRRLLREDSLKEAMDVVAVMGRLHLQATSKMANRKINLQTLTLICEKLSFQQ